MSVVVFVNFCFLLLLYYSPFFLFLFFSFSQFSFRFSVSFPFRLCHLQRGRNPLQSFLRVSLSPLSLFLRLSTSAFTVVDTFYYLPPSRLLSDFSCHIHFSNPILCFSPPLHTPPLSTISATRTYIATLEKQLHSLRRDLSTVYRSQATNQNKILSLVDSLREKDDHVRLLEEEVRALSEVKMRGSRKEKEWEERWKMREVDVQVSVERYFS